MKKIFILALLNFLVGPIAKSATILQVKGASAIVELSAAEFQNLQPVAGQHIQLSFSGKQARALIKKISNKKMLITSTISLAGQKIVGIKSDGSAGDLKDADISKNRSALQKSKLLLHKNWILGANLKYVTGSGNISITPFPSQTLKYSGFDASGIGIYYFGLLGIGFEGEYSALKGTTSIGKNTVTQVQLSFLGEYKIKLFSVGALLTLFSNLKDVDNLGNDNSLNGTGYGLFATYALRPQVRIILDYKMATYKLDPATYTSSDIRLGAGYYF